MVSGKRHGKHFRSFQECDGESAAARAKITELMTYLLRVQVAGAVSTAGRDMPARHN